MQKLTVAKRHYKHYLLDKHLSRWSWVRSTHSMTRMRRTKEDVNGANQFAVISPVLRAGASRPLGTPQFVLEVAGI